MIPDAAKELIESPALAHVSTIDRDGKAHVTLAWIGLDGDEIVLGTLFDQRKLQNMRRDPRVTLSIETSNINDYGLTEYLIVHGRARVTEGGAPELLQQLAYTYLGPDVRFPAMEDPPPGYVTRIAVDRLGGIGPWTD
ncbi:MAG: TIGR03618 family F420-dependent PPOX class oxidoreductase [Actinomycetota bacterium]